MPASLEGGSSSGPKIHPSPSPARHVPLLHSLQEGETNREEEGVGGGGVEEEAEEEKETCQHYWAI